jgi:hypothetical protein
MARAVRGFVDRHLPNINPLVRTVRCNGFLVLAPAAINLREICMASISLGQAVRFTELGKFTFARAIKSTWVSASRKGDGNYEIDGVEQENSASRLQALTPWRAVRSARAMAYAELRDRVALAEERVAELKTALDEMRAQRDAWQEMAQARIRPAPTSAKSGWSWLRKQ